MIFSDPNKSTNKKIICFQSKQAVDLKMKEKGAGNTTSKARKITEEKENPRNLRMISEILMEIKVMSHN